MPTKFLLIMMLGAALPALAQDSEPAARPVVPAVKDSRLTYGQAATLGVVEGVTEFLPVSSTGHLLAANEALGLNEDYQVLKSDGTPAWSKPPSGDRPVGEPFTRKRALDAYTVMIQVGAIGAVLLLYWPRIKKMILGILGFDRGGFLLLRNIFIALLPAVVLGLTLGDWIEEHLFSVRAVIIALAVGAILMLWVQAWQKRSSWRGTSTKDASDLTPGEAIFVGIAQCVAFWPGTSRSMMAIVGGYLTGLPPDKAAEFSFLLGLPTLGGAAVLTALKHGPMTIDALGLGPTILGCLVAFLAAAVAIKFLVATLVRFGLGPFAVYRLLFALGLLLTLGW